MLFDLVEEKKRKKVKKMPEASFSFPKSEKIVSKKIIDRLFAGSGSRAMSAFPVRLVYIILNEGDEALTVKGRNEGRSAAQVLISVPKRYFRHAVDRNRVKRQIREAYRKHRNLFALPEGKYLAMAFIWMDHRHHATEEVERKIVNLLQRMQEKSINTLVKAEA